MILAYCQRSVASVAIEMDGMYIMYSFFYHGTCRQPTLDDDIDKLMNDVFGTDDEDESLASDSDVDGMNLDETSPTVASQISLEDISLDEYDI